MTNTDKAVFSILSLILSTLSLYLLGYLDLGTLFINLIVNFLVCEFYFSMKK